MNTIQVRHVVGGVWPGAWFRRPDEARPASLPEWRIVSTEMQAQEINRHAHWGYEIWLSDLLGLGLAGLVGRVAKRLGVVLRPGHARLRRVMDHAARQPWCPPFEGGMADALPVISTYLALTDALCASVGLELAEGGVARWERWEEREDLPEGWMLTAGRFAWHLDGGGDDWLEALEAALDVVSSGE